MYYIGYDYLDYSIINRLKNMYFTVKNNTVSFSCILTFDIKQETFQPPCPQRAATVGDDPGLKDI